MKIKLNTDKELVAEIKEQLKETKGHCPCVNPMFYSNDTKCPCKDFREQKELGECHCGLYIKVAN